MTMNKFTMISNTNLSNMIDDWIKNERDRAIMKRRLIDGITIERLAEEFELSVTQLNRILSKYYGMLQSLCNEWVTISV